jgi:DNA-binding NtrC family response regulator
VRIVAATNRDLVAEVAARRFRQDLYFRLNGITLTIPPLRERVDEIEPLAKHFLAAACKVDRRVRVPTLTADALDALRRHDWPGNIRELRNVVERALLLCGHDAIGREHLRIGLGGPSPSLPPAGAVDEEEGLAPDEVEDRRRLLEALERCAGNQTYAAEMLGISRRTLVSRLQKYKIARPRTRPREIR